MPAAATANPVHAYVAFLRIPRFDSRPVAEQAQLKQRLEDGVLDVLAKIATHDRIVLDAADGMALVLFGDAEHALDIAQALHRQGGENLQIGLNYGPLALTTQGSEARVYGDALTAAAAASRFAEASRLLVTEAFAQALRTLSPDRARELANAGDFTDTQVRLHKFYTPEPRLRSARHRRIAAYSVAGAVAILLIGVIGRDIYQPLFQSRPAVVKLEVKPRAEVFVDGVSQGRTPPLGEIQVPPGKRVIALRQAGYRPVELVMQVKPGQRVTVTQSLQRLPEPKPELWRDLKKKFGS